MALIATLLLATFPGWHREVDDRGSERDVKYFPSKPKQQVTLVAVILASSLAVVSMMWQHTASAAVATTVQDMGYGSIKSEVGAAAMALGWVSVGVLVIAAIKIMVDVWSITLLDRLTDE